MMKILIVRTTVLATAKKNSSNTNRGDYIYYILRSLVLSRNQQHTIQFSTSPTTRPIHQIHPAT